MRIEVRAYLIIAAIAVFNWIASAPARAESPARILPVEIVPSIGHSQMLTSVAYSPDGRQALSGSADGTAKLWDVATGKLLRTVSCGFPVQSVAFAPGGLRLLTGSGDRVVKMWDALTGKLVQTFEGHHDYVPSVTFSADGRSVLTGSGDKTIRMWDAATGKLIHAFEGHSKDVNSISFSPDGRLVLSGSDDGTLKLWDAGTAKPVRTFERRSDGVTSVAFSSDGHRVLSGNSDGTLKVWDAGTGELIRSFDGLKFENRGYGEARTVAFSPDGTSVVAASGGGAAGLWDTATGKLLHEFEGFSVAFSPDGRSILSGGATGMQKLWDAASGRLVRAFDGRNDELFSVAHFPDGRSFNVDNELADEVFSVSYSPDGRNVLSGGGDGTVKLWDATTGRPITTFWGHVGPAYSVAFSPNGRSVLSGGSDFTAKLWEAPTGGLPKTFAGHADRVTSVAFSPDGRNVLTGSWDKTAKLWDAETGKQIRTFAEQGHYVNSVAFSPDARRVASGVHDGTIKLWDIATGKLIRSFTGVGNYVVTSVAFSLDGHRIASGGGPGTLNLWDVATGRLIRTFPGKFGTTHSIAFSRDGRNILSGGTDDAPKLWDGATGQLLKTFEGQHSEVRAITFSPDGTRVIAAKHLTIELFQASTGQPLASILSTRGGEWVTITPEGFFDASEKGAQALTVVRGLEVYSVDQVYQALYRPDLVREKLAGDPQGKVREATAKLDLAKVIASGGAPRVEITAPKSGATVTDEQINVEATVTNQGGGVGKVEWRVNGVTLGVEQRGLGPETSAATTVSVHRQLTLEPGDNRIEIVAYNARGLIASEPARVAVKWSGEKASTPPRLYVLAVGVNDYWDSRLKLNFAAPDARAIGDGLRQAGTNLYERVEVTTVIDADATNANLDHAFSELAAKIRPRDVFVFFLAGHGKTVDGRYYFLPYDFRYQGEDSFASKGVGQDRWQEWFARIPARKSVLLYDTCESGSLTGERVALRGIERVAALEKMTRAMGRTVLSASTDDTPALEGYRGHGVFTYVVLDALDQAHANPEGLISVTDLAAYIDEKVPELSNVVFKMRQVPQMNIVGSNFPLVRKTAVLPATSMGPGTTIAPAKPTHVVVTTARVREAPKGDASVVTELTAGTQVQLVETAEGWVLIARDGKKLGYLEVKELARLQ